MSVQLLVQTSEPQRLIIDVGTFDPNYNPALTGTRSTRLTMASKQRSCSRPRMCARTTRLSKRSLARNRARQWFCSAWS
jgi:hypothetical protein